MYYSGVIVNTLDKVCRSQANAMDKVGIQLLHRPSTTERNVMHVKIPQGEVPNFSGGHSTVATILYNKVKYTINVSLLNISSWKF